MSVTKAEWRRSLLAARRARGGADRRVDADRLAAALPEVLAGAGGAGAPVCLVVPVGTEPGAVDGPSPVLEAALALGRDVLLPVVVGSAPLDWAPYTGPESLVAGPHGLLEPAGPRRGPDAVAGAAIVVVPALAVDRHGTRLGRGAGHYDRSLPLAVPAPRLVGLVGDDELVDEPLPAEEHDVRMHAVWRPRHGVTELSSVTELRGTTGPPRSEHRDP